MQVWYKAIKASLCFLVASGLPTHTDAQQSEIEGLPPVQHLKAHQGGLRSIQLVSHWESVASQQDIEISPVPAVDPSTGPLFVDESCHLIIQPPIMQPYKDNQYTFVVKNLGQLDAHDVLVELRVPETSRIVAAMPDHALVTDQVVKVRLDLVQVAEQINIHLTAVSASKEPITFQAKLTHTSDQEFGPRTSTGELSTRRASHHASTGAVPFQVASTGPRSNLQVPIVSRKPDYQPRPNFQRNPHFLDDGSDLLAGELDSNPFQVVSDGRLTTSVGPVNERLDYHPPSLDLSGANDFVHPDAREMLVEPKESQYSPSDRIYADVMETPELPSEIIKLSPTSSMGGARTMALQSNRAFEVVVTNPLSKTAKNVLVQLTIPQGMKVTSFDRQTWFDEESNTLSFRIRKILPGQSESIHYQMKAIASGFQIQKLVVEATSLERSEVRFDTYVKDR